MVSLNTTKGFRIGEFSSYCCFGLAIHCIWISENGKQQRRRFNQIWFRFIRFVVQPLFAGFNIAFKQLVFKARHCPWKISPVTISFMKSKSLTAVTSCIVLLVLYIHVVFHRNFFTENYRQNTLSPSLHLPLLELLLNNRKAKIVGRLFSGAYREYMHFSQI